MSADVYRRRRVIAAADVDGLGHVNNTVWVRFIIELADAHSSARGFDWKTVRALGGQWIVRRHEIDYLRSAVPGEEIVEETWVASIRGARSVRMCRFTRPSDGLEYVTSTTQWAFTDKETQKPRRIPLEILKEFAPVP